MIIKTKAKVQDINLMPQTIVIPINKMKMMNYRLLI